MKEAKMPCNPCGQGINFEMCEIFKRKLLDFFVDFLNEHIEFSKENNWDVIKLEALKINFQDRFMDRNEGQK